MASEAGRRWVWTAVLLVILGLARPLWSQGLDFSDLLSGKSHPLSMKLQDLNGDWRRITLQTSASVSDNLSVNVNGNSGGSTSQNNLIGAFTGSRTYLTKGQTVSACGRAYLVAYHLPGSALDLSAIIQAVATKTPPTAAVLTLESSLPLSLLDLQVIGSLDDVRAFDLPSEIKESERFTKLLADLLKSQAGGTSTNAPPSKREAPQIGS